jgi:hypothetical protein
VATATARTPRPPRRGEQWHCHPRLAIFGVWGFRVLLQMSRRVHYWAGGPCETVTVSAPRHPSDAVAAREQL